MSLLFEAVGGSSGSGVLPSRNLPVTKHKSGKSVNAKRKKIRRASQIVNYVTGNSLIDWLMSHPDKVHLKVRPINIKTTYKTPNERFLDKIDGEAKKLKLTCKRLPSSNYGCETILAMRESHNIILNCTLADRSTGYMCKVDALVKSTVINRFTADTLNLKLKLKLKDVPSGTSGGIYIPVCFGPDAEMNIAIALNILLKYQNAKPSCGLVAHSSDDVKVKFTEYTPSPTNYEVIENAVNWLNDMDELTSEAVIGANGHINNTSPWCLAVKMHALDQENITMLPNVECVSPLEWRMIDEYKGRRQAEWVDNYYSSTGKNMSLFKQLFKDVKIVHKCMLDGVVYQAAHLDTATGEISFCIADNLETGLPVDMDLNVLTDGCITLTWEDMKAILVKNDIKFPYTSNYDLDFICMRSLSVHYQALVPIVNFSVEEVAREYYYGDPDKKNMSELYSYLKNACERVPIILYLLIKMSQA